uniref:Uncharacterized protein n=1 Tax=Arundo donax TaxID=35708 RepID=A0A0A9D3P5_ARUDO
MCHNLPSCLICISISKGMSSSWSFFPLSIWSCPAHYPSSHFLILAQLQVDWSRGLCP